MRRVVAAISAVRAARWTDVHDVAEAQVALLRAELLRRLRPAGELVEPAKADDAGFVSAKEREAYVRLSLAVDRATRYGVFRPQCLAQALALSHMLAIRGFTAHRIRIGVRRDEIAFSAHAWVELIDASRAGAIGNTSGYAALTAVSLSRGGRASLNQRFRRPSDVQRRDLDSI